MDQPCQAFINKPTANVIESLFDIRKPVRSCDC